MSAPGSPRGAPNAESIATAAESRLQAIRQLTNAEQLAKEHETRQEFRRLINPGITRPNSRVNAIETLKVLRTLGDNILREPTNPKFLRFKPTNNTIKRVLIDRPGALEYAIRLGFQPQIENFQPYYHFNTRKLEDLRIGVSILTEILDLDAQEQQRLEFSRQQEKAARDVAKKQVKLAFMDDRKSVDQRVEAERATRKSTPANKPGQIQQASTEMPGEGYSLSGDAARPATRHSASAHQSSNGIVGADDSEY